MKPETLELQQLLDPTTGAQAVEERQFPIAVQYTAGSKGKYLMLSANKEIYIKQWPHHFKATGLEYLDDGSATEIPVADFIAELKSIIAELEK